MSDTATPGPAVPDEVVAELLAAGAEGFVAARTTASRRIRPDDRELAAAIAALRKPVRIVWRLHEVVAASPDAATHLVAAAATARDAQERGDGAGLRTSTAAVRDAIVELVGADLDLGQALRALVAHAAALDALVAGTLLALPTGDPPPARTVPKATADAPADVPSDGPSSRGRTPRPRPALRSVPSPEPDEAPPAPVPAPEIAPEIAPEVAPPRSVRTRSVDARAVRSARAAVRSAEAAEDRTGRALDRAREQLAAARTRADEREAEHAEAVAAAEAARTALAALTAPVEPAEPD